MSYHTTGALPYAIPTDNTFVAGGGHAREIWAYGMEYLRLVGGWNKKITSNTGHFQRQNIRRRCGQKLYEEVDICKKGQYGWKVMEGLHCYNPATGCNMTGPDVHRRIGHAEGICVIGG